jgi:hypothetical protein
MKGSALKVTAIKLTLCFLCLLDSVKLDERVPIEY